MSDPRKPPMHSAPAGPDGDPPSPPFDGSAEPVGYESALPFLRAGEVLAFMPAVMPGDTPGTPSQR